MTWDDVIKMRDNIPDTDIYEKLILYLYTYFPPRKIRDYHQMYYSNRTSEEMMEEDEERIILHLIVSLFLIHIKLLSYINKKHLTVQ